MNKKLQKSASSHNPFAAEGFKVPSTTHKCCCVAVRIGKMVEIRDTKNPKSPTLPSIRKSGRLLSKASKTTNSTREGVAEGAEHAPSIYFCYGKETKNQSIRKILCIRATEWICKSATFYYCPWSPRVNGRRFLSRCNTMVC